MNFKRDDLPHLGFAAVVTGEVIPPPPPGAILYHEFMAPNALSANALAVALRVPLPRIEGIVERGRGISPETALRLARYFGTSAEFWARLDTNHALRIARAAAGPTIEREIQPLTA